MRDWLPDEIVDKLEELGEKSLPYVVANTTVGLISDLHKGDLQFLVAVALDRQTEDIASLLFVVENRFVQYWLGGQDTWSLRGTITRQQLRKLGDDWSSLQGEEEELSDSDDLIPRLTGNAIWVLQPTAH